jgi:Metal-dependent hydrolases of the beta-lactamase superfamily I
MQLKVLGASSAGNCYLLENDTECLILDAGIKSLEIKKALDFNISKVVGVVVSHSHGDHAKYVKDYLDMGIKAFRPYETNQRTIEFGNFKIKAFELEHDVPCFGFYIAHEEIGKLVYITDTKYVKYKFENLDHIMVECNHSRELIYQNMIQSLGERIMNTHMGLDTCKGFVQANNSPNLRNIVLMHLSSQNSDEKLFKREIERVVSCPVYIAAKGLEVNLDKIPF